MMGLDEGAVKNTIEIFLVGEGDNIDEPKRTSPVRLQQLDKKRRYNARRIFTQDSSETQYGLSLENLREVIDDSQDRRVKRVYVQVEASE